jgi:hypothetical protein
VIAPESGILNCNGAGQTKFVRPAVSIISIRTFTASDLSPQNARVNESPDLRFVFGVASKFLAMRRSPSVGR